MYTEHSFWLHSEAVRAKGVGFLVSKGAQAKLPLLDMTREFFLARADERALEIGI